MNGKLYIKKFIRDDGETLSFDAEEIYLSENNTLLVRSDPATTAVEFTEEDGGEMIRQRGATYSQPVSGLIVPKSTEYWALCVRLSRFFILNHTYKIVYIKRDGSMFSMNRAWINAGLQIVPVPYENYSTWTIEFRIGDSFWTEYAEDSQGKEIYSNSVELPLLTAGTGGEVWSDATQQTLSGVGNYFAIDGTSISANINKLELGGDTFQQTYSGIQLLTGDGYATPSSQTTYWQLTSNTSNENLGNAWGRWTTTQNTQWVNIFSAMSTGISGGAYKPDTEYTILVEWANAQNVRDINISQETASVNAFVGGNISVTDIGSHPNGSQKFVLTTKPTITQGMYALRSFITKNTAADTAKIDLRVTIVEGDYSSTNLSWQPFVGGTPSPNPEYPQGIHVVTGEQTVTVTGKNLFNSYALAGKTLYPASCQMNIGSDGTITLTGNTGSNGYCRVMNTPLRDFCPKLEVGKIYYLYLSGNNITHNQIYLNSSGFGWDAGTSRTITQSDLDSDIVVYGGYNTTTTIKIMITETQDSNYEPYQSQSYTVDLGSIELCKIGDYQDYIYKSGDDWYMHKETGGINLYDYINSSWYVSSSNTGSVVKSTYSSLGITNIVKQASGILPPSLSNYFTLEPSGKLYSGEEKVGYAVGADGLYFGNNDWTVAQFKDFITNNTVYVYYALETSTDTKITNATLVAELNALAGAQAYNGKTVYQTNSATMPAILSVELLQSVGGGEVWDNVGAVWEEGVGGVQTINVETTQTTYPVWTVTGPCSNPTLQNDTTDTLASFDGMIASGQTLTVNFADNTAYLDSAPVAKYVSGYVSLAPGENVVGFNSDGGSTQTSTISWDNIIN